MYYVIHYIILHIYVSYIYSFNDKGNITPQYKLMSSIKPSPSRITLKL